MQAVPDWAVPSLIVYIGGGRTSKIHQSKKMLEEGSERLPITGVAVV